MTGFLWFTICILLIGIWYLFLIYDVGNKQFRNIWIIGTLIFIFVTGMLTGIWEYPNYQKGIGRMKESIWSCLVALVAVAIMVGMMWKLGDQEPRIYPHITQLEEIK